MKSRIPPIFGFFLFFAVIGFFRTFMANPVNVLVMIGLSALLLYLVHNYLKSGRFLPRVPFQAQKPKQPAKASKTTIKKSGHSPRKDNPFRVIEGSKGKTKQNDGEKPKMYQ